MRRLLVLALLLATAGTAALFLGGSARATASTTGSWTLYPAQTATIGYQATVQQPINPDGSSSWPAKRGVIPVQFSLAQTQTFGPVVFQSICSDNTIPSACSGGNTANDYSYLSFAPSTALTLAGITNLSATYAFTTGNCHGGSLRWELDTSVGNVFVYYGAYPNFTDCTTVNQSGVNMTTTGDLRVDTSQIAGGNFYDTWAHAVTLLGTTPIQDAALVLDSGWGGDQVATVSNVTVNDNTFVPQTGTTTTPTCNLPTAKITLNKFSGADQGPIDETLAAQSSDTGGIYRIVDCKYIYNLDVSSLSGIGLYRVYVNIGGQNVDSPGTFGLR
jgi:hypothetical protein